MIIPSREASLTRLAMAYPWSGPAARARRMSKYNVPGKSSEVRRSAMIFPFPDYTYTGQGKQVPGRAAVRPEEELTRSQLTGVRCAGPLRCRRGLQLWHCPLSSRAKSETHQSVGARERAMASLGSGGKT